MYQGDIEFPRQKLTRKKKTDQWTEDCIESGLSLVGVYDNTRRSPKARKKRNYDLYNGKFDKEDLEYVTNPLGIDTGNMPANIQYYDIVSPIFNLLFGEEVKRPFRFVVRAINEDAVSTKEEDQKSSIVEAIQQSLTAIRDSVMSQQMQAVQEQEMTPEIQQQMQQQAEAAIPQSMKDLEKYFEYDFQDMNESTATKLLNYLEKDLKLKIKFQKGWEDSLIAGEEIYCIEEVGGEPVCRNVNPLEFYCFLPHNSDNVDDANIIVEETWMSISQVLDKFYEDLTPKDIDKLEELQGSRTKYDNGLLNYGPSEKLVIETDQEYSANSNQYDYYDQNGNLRVAKVVWKSMKKVGRLTYIDETGAFQETIVGESYKVDKEAGEGIKWMWVNEYWEGTKIGDDIYVNVGPKVNQFRKLTNLSKCKSGYVGTIYNCNNSQSVSLMDRLVPWIYLYVTIWYRVELAIAANQGKIALIDLSLVPDGWEIDKWLYYAQAMKFGFVDSFNEGKKGQSTGKLAGNISTQNKVLDMETGNYIQQHIQLLEFTEGKIQTLSGVTRQRMGAIATSELVGNTERAVVQSSHITEKWFEVHNQTKSRVLETLIDVGKETFAKQNKKLQYITDDLSTQIFNITKDFRNTEYGVFVSNSAKDAQALDMLKQLTQVALQSDKMDLNDVISVYNSRSLSDIRRHFERAENEKDAEVQQQQQMQMQQAREQQQTQIRIKQDEENREDRRNSEDNLTKIKVAEINAASKQDGDLDNDGIADRIEQDKLNIQQEKNRADISIKQQKLDIDRDKVKQDSKAKKAKDAKK